VDPQAPGTTTKTGVTTGGQNRTATLVVTPEQAQKLELAKNQGKISLSLRNPMDRSMRSEGTPSTMEQIDPLLLSRSGQAGRRGLRLPGGNARDPRAWAALIGEEEPKPAAAPKPPVEKKEPPKPRAVVDVYRGDKHVQEIFQ
jgi:Flp pilus assembly protein CpaB